MNLSFNGIPSFRSLLSSMMPSLLLSLVVSVIVTAIVVHNSSGRISRNRYWKFQILMFLGFCLYGPVFWVAFFITVRFFFHSISIALIMLLLLCYIIGYIIFVYKYMQLQVRRYQDMGYSGWYLMLQYIPLLNIYLIILRFIKKRTSLINEFDESIDYLHILKKMGLYPKMTFIVMEGVDFYINNVKFECKKNNGHTQYEVSAITLEDDKMLNEYCRKNLKQTENASGYMNSYKISFLDEGNLLEKIKKDLNALIIKEGFVLGNGMEFLVRDNYGLYEIVYENAFADKIKSYSEFETLGDYSCQTLNKDQLRNLLLEAV